jgi:hypothetical protein
VDAQLDRQLDLAAVTGREADGVDVGLEAAEQRGVRVGLEAGRPEVRRQPHEQHVGGLAGRADRLRVGAAHGHERRVEDVPDRRVGVAVAARACPRG